MLSIQLDARRSRSNLRAKHISCFQCSTVLINGNVNGKFSIFFDQNDWHMDLQMEKITERDRNGKRERERESQNGGEERREDLNKSYNYIELLLLYII